MTNRRNLILVLLFIELMLLAVNINFLMIALTLDNIIGIIFALFIIMIAGAEVSIGLAFVILVFRVKGVINLNFFISLKG